MRVLLLALSLGFLTSAVFASETYYKWQDAQGTWHYTQTPPPASAQSSAVSIHPGEGKATDPTEAEANKSSTQPADEKKRRMEFCETAKKNVAVLEKNSVVTTDTSGSGHEKPLTPEQHQNELRRAQAMVTLYCNPAP